MASSRSSTLCDLPLPDGFFVHEGRIGYAISADEEDYLETLAIGRDESYPGEGDPKRRARRDGDKVHLAGLKGEHATAQFYDLTLDESMLASGDDGADFHVLLDGDPATIDVKATTHTPPWLQTMATNTTSSHYLGTYVDDAFVYFLGIATREQMLAGEFGKTTGMEHDNYKLTEDELDPLPIPDRIVEHQPASN